MLSDLQDSSSSRKMKLDLQSSSPSKKMKLDLQRSSSSENMEIDEEKSNFLVKVLNIDYRTILYSTENINDSAFSRHHMDERLIESVTRRLEPALEGVDLGDVKHYAYSHLKPYIKFHDPKISRLDNCSLYRGVADYRGQPRHVVIKKWNLQYPQSPSSAYGRVYEKHPTRLYNEMQLLTEGPMKSLPHVPKLIGYSIDSTLAVVYDLKAKDNLSRCKVKSENDKLKMAVKVGRVLQDFHDKGIGVGYIDSESILLDEEDKIYFCEFGLTEVAQKMMNVKIPVMETFGGHGICSPEMSSEKSEIKKWTLETDIFAYGVLLLEIVSGEVAEVMPEIFVKRVFDSAIPPDDKIRHLVNLCMVDNPGQRPKIANVVDDLDKLIKPDDVTEEPKLALRSL